MFHAAVTAGLEAALSVTGLSVSLRRGVVTRADITAMPGRKQRPVLDAAQGVSLQFNGQDWIFRTADYALIDGEPVEPQPGDQILQTVGATTLTFEIIRPLQQAEAAWYYCDDARTFLRVHTVLT